MRIFRYRCTPVQGSITVRNDDIRIGNYTKRRGSPRQDYLVFRDAKKNCGRKQDEKGGTIMETTEKWEKELLEELRTSDYVLVGLGREWFEADDAKFAEKEIAEGYRALEKLLAGKDYFIVTTSVDGRIYEYLQEEERITAPCGNLNWLQCPDACATELWVTGEVEDGCCPHCGKPLIANTCDSDNYIEEGYLRQWKKYQQWLAGTLNRKLLMLELGVDFTTPLVIRFAFEKTVFLNQKSHMYRVSKRWFQITEEIRERAVPVESDSVEFVRKLASNC